MLYIASAVSLRNIDDLLFECGFDGCQDPMGLRVRRFEYERNRTLARAAQPERQVRQGLREDRLIEGKLGKSILVAGAGGIGNALAGRYASEGG